MFLYSNPVCNKIRDATISSRTDLPQSVGNNHLGDRGMVCQLQAYDRHERNGPNVSAGQWLNDFLNLYHPDIFEMSLFSSAEALLGKYGVQNTKRNTQSSLNGFMLYVTRSYRSWMIGKRRATDCDLCLKRLFLSRNCTYSGMKMGWCTQQDWNITVFISYK